MRIKNLYKYSSDQRLTYIPILRPIITDLFHSSKLILIEQRSNYFTTHYIYIILHSRRFLKLINAIHTNTYPNYSKYVATTPLVSYYSIHIPFKNYLRISLLFFNFSLQFSEIAYFVPVAYFHVRRSRKRIEGKSKRMPFPPRSRLGRDIDSCCRFW